MDSRGVIMSNNMKSDFAANVSLDGLMVSDFCLSSHREHGRRFVAASTLVRSGAGQRRLGLRPDQIPEHSMSGRRPNLLLQLWKLRDAELVDDVLIEFDAEARTIGNGNATVNQWR